MNFFSSSSISSASDEIDDYDGDEFFFQSIQRYNTLQMFHLENVPYHLVQLSDTLLCVANKRSNGESSELLKLKLPTKLTLPPEEEGRSKENDFKILSGIYAENLIYKIDKLESGNKLITSENNISGLQIYSFSDSTLGKKNPEQKLDVTPWTGTDFSVLSETAKAVCSKCCHEPVIHVDVSTGKIVKDIKHPFYTFNVQPQEWPKKIDPCSVNTIKCKSLGADLIAVLNTHSGDVILHDLRTEDIFISLSWMNEKLSEEIWTISGCDYTESSFNYFGILSNKTSFCIFDKRKNSVVIQNIGENDPLKNHGSMKLKFNSSGDKFSISGMNSFVQIFRINDNNFEHVFTHNGHCPNNLPSSLTTDHLWLQAGGNEYIVSICDNKTLNCWNYKT